MTPDDIENAFQAWLEDIRQDKSLAPEMRAHIIKVMATDRRVYLTRAADLYEPSEMEDEDPEYVIYLPSIPDVPLEADDDVEELLSWCHTVGFAVSFHFYADQRHRRH